MIQNYFFSQLGLVDPIIIRRLGSPFVKNVITKNLTDSIIAITWNGIKCAKGSVGILFRTLPLRL